MGAFVSSSTRSRAKGSSKGQSSKKFQHPRASGGSKRSSIHRPVLQLQVEPDTLEKVRKRTGSDGTLMVTRSELHSLAKGSGAYENLFPRPRYGSSGSSNHAHASRHHSTGSHGSQDSMVLLQIVENDGHLLISTNNDCDYDHLLPKGDYSHLCEVTYGHFHEHEGGRGEEEAAAYGTREQDDHRASILYGRGRSGSILMTSGLSADELKQRIHHHKSPAREGSFRRSQSASTLATYELIAQGPSPPEERLLNSAGPEDESSDYWTLGESIIRTLSRRDMLSFDFENPQLKSEHTILEAWPKLKEKLKKKQHSQSTVAVNGWV